MADTAAPVQNIEVTPAAEPAAAPAAPSSQRGSAVGAPPAVAAPSSAGSVAGSAGAGLVAGLQQAHADFVNWWYQPHGSVIDQQLRQLDANGMKREFVGYGLAGLVVLLLCTPLAPLVANLICIGYPIGASLSVLRGQSTDSNRFLIYWTIFGVLSVFDYYSGESTLYWIIKIAACLVLYLPQTQGAALVYSLAIEPLANAVARAF